MGLVLVLHMFDGIVVAPEVCMVHDIEMALVLVALVFCMVFCMVDGIVVAPAVRMVHYIEMVVGIQCSRAEEKTNTL